MTTVGEPLTGNLYERFDEGNGLAPVPTLPDYLFIVLRTFNNTRKLSN